MYAMKLYMKYNYINKGRSNWRKSRFTRFI